jgi:uncharacterized membrane protein
MIGNETEARMTSEPMAAASGVDGRRGVGWMLVLAGSLAIGLASLRYLIPHGPGLAPPVLANRFAHLGVLTVHAGFAAAALIVGPLQFLPTLRHSRPSLHRAMGRVYVAACLLGGAAGLVLAFGAATGPVSTAGFGLLALAWMTATTRAFLAARGRRFETHRRWMIRSFALTFAAVTLRLYMPFAFLSPIGYDNTYRAISFLCWVPNLLAAEWLLASTRLGRPAPTAGRPARIGSS